MSNSNAGVRDEMDVQDGWSSGSEGDPPILMYGDDQAVCQRVNRRLGMIMQTGSLGQLPDQPPTEAQPTRPRGRSSRASTPCAGPRVRPVFERAVRQRTARDFAYTPEVTLSTYHIHS